MTSKLNSLNGQRLLVILYRQIDPSYVEQQIYLSHIPGPLSDASR
jgi:hypothetical protein